ncbi:shikimate kinase [Bacillus salipaludis]|uniref:Shikimate kinase n=1 Tax=Bacillus salipaludis TaxID=2547811 RepID=A0A4V3ATB9_9BACI|nr:shikimate kinase [Bacillus salipaludis]MDQ6596170.1 shikimate kinase [Bacillus salipaludis]TDK59197.1 shikimate kinase [Bacillus salipaludis]
MGAGKTTVGKILAEKLNREFIDIDEEIENEFNLPVSQIFKQYGESTFRSKEKSLITEKCNLGRQIISVGGGAFLQEEIRKICLSTCTVIFLDISWECWKGRISLIIDSRPVLQGKSLEEMEELFYKRQEVYVQHHVKIQTDYKGPEEAADEIIDLLKLVEKGNGL